MSRYRQADLWLRAVVGRRGASLLFFGSLDMIYALSMLTASPKTISVNTTYRWFSEIAPLPLWAGLWFAVGTGCVYHAFHRYDRYGFAAAIGIKIIWGFGALAGWLFDDLSPGSFAIWLGLAGLVWVISGWREPEPVGEDVSHDG